jgi:hypothetical protein
MASQPDQNSMVLGEVRGQMREVVHSMNNLSMKFDGLSREVVGLGILAGAVAKLELKVAALEVEKNRRDGASGFAGLLLKSPALGWLVGAAVSAWAILTGKVHV